MKADTKADRLRRASEFLKLCVALSPEPQDTKKIIENVAPKKKSSPRKQYYKKVKELTENNNLSSLPNSDRRGFFDHHLDHKIPIAYGFKNNILPSLIAHIDNLRFIPHNDNMDKRDELYVDEKNRWILGD